MKGMQPTQRAIAIVVLGLAACADKEPDDGLRPSAPPSNVTAGDASAGRTDAAVPSSQLDAAVATCPAARPAEATSCQVSTTLCAYAEIECRCPAGLWSCMEPVHPGCPATTPSAGSACSLPEATECDYLDQECECLSGVWMCQSEDEDDAAVGPDAGAQVGDGGPDAGRDGGADAGGSCPQARPAELTTCARSSLMCTYESTKCVCPDGLWSCTEPVDMGCPATTPLHGDPCRGIADCDFLEVECECLRGAWSCKPND